MGILLNNGCPPPEHTTKFVPSIDAPVSPGSDDQLQAINKEELIKAAKELLNMQGQRFMRELRNIQRKKSFAKYDDLEEEAASLSFFVLCRSVSAPTPAYLFQEVYIPP